MFCHTLSYSFPQPIHVVLYTFPNIQYWRHIMPSLNRCATYILFLFAGTCGPFQSNTSWKMHSVAWVVSHLCRFIFFKSQSMQHREQVHTCIMQIIADKRNDLRNVGHFAIWLDKYINLWIYTRYKKGIMVPTLAELWCTSKQFKIGPLVLIHFWYSFDTLKSVSNILWYTQ